MHTLVINPACCMRTGVPVANCECPGHKAEREERQRALELAGRREEDNLLVEWALNADGEIVPKERPSAPAAPAVVVNLPGFSPPARDDSQNLLPVFTINDQGEEVPA